MKRKRDGEIGGVDRISELPEHIIHGIMSHLSSKEVAQTCVLSKTWYRLKRYYPVLNFETPSYIKPEEISDWLIKFCRVVYDSLQHFSPNEFPLQAFCLRIDILPFNKPEISSDLDNWIRLALAKGVQELKIWAWIYMLPKYLTLPQPLFCSKTLTSLELTRCVLDLPLSIFNFLRKLVIFECSLGGPIILKGNDCPVLEELTVKRCSGKDFKTIYISRLLRLHTFVLSAMGEYCKLETVEISSPIIQSVAIRASELLPWSVIYNIRGCNRLKVLSLYARGLTDAEFHSLLLNFPLLEELYLFHFCLRMLKISSPLLKTLEIIDYVSSDSCLNNIELSSPNLENFIYRTYNERTSYSKSPRIKVADCCHSLKTLVLCGYLFRDKTFQNLLLRFPLLENVWIIECHRLQRINVPNLQLKRLHIVRCDELKAVNVSSPNLCEFCCTDCEVPKFSVADDVCASGLKVECGVHSSSRECLLRLKEMMMNFVHVKDEWFLYGIINFR